MLEVSRLTRSPPDSERFQLEVWRASAIGTEEQVLPELVASGADIAIYRLPTAESGPVRRLAQRGLEVIDAGVLVYYTMDLARHIPRPLANADIEISMTGAGDDAEMAGLVDASFDGYISHYLANPLIASDKALAGYRQWALRHRLTPERTASWVARREGRIVAFACCEFDSTLGICNGGIYGVLPGQSRGGLFGDLIRYTQAYFRQRGYIEMRMSTKVDNVAVQKVWAREGYHLYAAYDTLHVNALLSHGRAHALRRRIRIDRSPPHGLLLEAGFSALLREHPGFTDMHLTALSETRLASLDCEHEHVLTVSAPALARRDGLGRAVATLHDEAGALAMLGYASFCPRMGKVG